MADRGFFTATDSFASVLQVSDTATKPALTKVACTLGPCSRDVETLEKMLEAGMACARFDFSWGDKDYHSETMENLLRAVRHTKLPCAMMFDTAGTEIHCYNKSGGKIEMQKGQSVLLTCDDSVEASSEKLPLSIDSFTGMALPQGTNVFVGQYLFTGSETTSAYITVTEVVDDKNVLCVANDDATLAGLDFIVNFSCVRSPRPILSERNENAIRTFGKISVFAANSSTSHPSIAHLASKGLRADWCRVGLASTKILAKIESQTALINFSDILTEADGIVFSRGLVGLDIEAEKIFRVQKYVIDECNSVSKPVIVTRVMDTMTQSPRPTRAEATDIANVVLDGADCLLLGAETFRGKHPIATIKAVQEIAKQAEMTFDSEVFHQKKAEEALDTVGEEALLSLAHSAVRAADLIKADLVIVFTISGRAARILSKFRPPVPILAVVFPKLVSNGLKWTFTGESEARQLLISRNCVPILADPNLGGAAEVEDTEMEGSMLNRAIAYAYSKKWIQLGSRIVLSQHAKKNMDYAFKETGVFKIIVAGDEVLDSAIETYNVHSESVQTLKKTMFSQVPRSTTFKGISVNEKPALIPVRKPKQTHNLCPLIPERSSAVMTEEDEREDVEVYEFSDVPKTPDESLLNQVPSPSAKTEQLQRRSWFTWRRN